MSDHTLVRISFSFAMSPEDYLAMCRHAADPIARQPGLIWKIWPLDTQNRLGGGVYLFATEADALRYVQGPIITQLRNAPGLHDITISVTGVAGELSAITHAPLARPTEPVA